MDRIAAGDASAFEELVRRHGGQMLRTARYLLKHEADAQDVVQEAFLAVHRHIRTFEGNAPLIAWLRRIVINQALMKLRCRKRLREEYIDDTSSRFDEPGAHLYSSPLWQECSESRLARAQTRRFVRAMVDQLPDIFRTAIVLRDIEELSTKDAADALGISETAMKVRLHRARNALRALLERRLVHHEEVLHEVPRRR
ncbi:MAG: sigma-70 family RNA polymerase sigma factor [Myxococcota bacterium]